MTPIIAIAENTFREAVRQKFFNFLLILSIGLIVSSNFFRQFDFGQSELKFIADFGLGSIFVFGSILSIVATAQLFFSEIENRTALNLLSKPVDRWQFIVGKFLGLFLLLLVFTALMSCILAVVLYWRESQLMERHADAFANGRIVSYSGVLLYGLIQLLKFSMLSGITLFVSSFSNTNLYSVVVSFFIMIICQLQYIAQDYWQQISIKPLGYLVGTLGLIFPNFQLFNVGELLVFDEADVLSLVEILKIFAYALAYLVFFNFITVYSFKNREI